MSDEETIGSRLQAMRNDLVVLVDKLNRDDSAEMAAKAQAVLLSLDELRSRLKRVWFPGIRVDMGSGSGRGLTWQTTA